MEDVSEDMKKFTDYIKNELERKHHEVIKSLMLIPFHWILRQDEGYAGRSKIRFVVLYGAPGAFKNGVVNIVRNMFDFYNTIPIDDGGAPKTYASLRNELSDNLGIVMCDESDGAFIDKNKKFKNSSDVPVENLLKGIFQEHLPKVSTQEIGKNTKQKFHGTPVFIWNDDFKKTKALEDRCFALYFDKQFNTGYKNLFDINEHKKAAVYFGKAFASCLKKYWKDELRKYTEFEQLINAIYFHMKEDYKIDVDFLIKTEIEEEDEFLDIFDIFFDRMHNKIRNIFNYQAYIINENEAKDELWDLLSAETSFIKYIGTRSNNQNLYFDRKKFITYIRDVIAEDGGLLEKDIEEKFQLDTNGGKYHKRENVECYKMKKTFFMKNINKFVDDDDNDDEEKSESNAQTTIL